MQNTWKPVVAGILNIITSVGYLLGLLAVIIAGIVAIAVASGPIDWNYIPSVGPVEVGLTVTIWLIVLVFLAVLGILPLLGGIYALKRKKWGLVLAGSIVAIFGSWILGILSTIFIALSREEFE